MMKEPKLEVIHFQNEDVIATSALLGQTGYFYIDDGNGGYSSFNGSFNAYDGSVYGITGTFENVEYERELLINGKNGVYDADSGNFFPAFILEPIAKQTYDAYSSGAGYYSNGQSYYELYWQ